MSYPQIATCGLFIYYIIYSNYKINNLKNMHTNKPIDRQDVDEVVEPVEYYDKLIELAESVGLIHTGINEWGEPDFMGTQRQCDRLNELRLKNNI